MVEQPVLEGPHSMERTHVRAVSEELQHVGRTHSGQVHGKLFSVGSHTGAKEEYEEEGKAEATCDELTATPIPCLPVPLRESR